MNRLSTIFLTVFLINLAACAAATPEPVEPTKPAATAAPAQATVTPTSTATAGPTATEAAVEAETAEELDAFIEKLQSAVAGQDYAEMQALMNDAVSAGLWRSQWQTLTPAEMVAQFQNGTVPGPFSVQFSDMSLDEIMLLLDGQPPEGMLGTETPVAAVLYSSGWGPFAADEALLFVSAEDGRYYWTAFLYTNGRFTDADLELISAPVGTIYSLVNDGIYQVQPDGARVQLLDPRTAATPNLKISPDGRHAAYLNEERRLWLIDTATGVQEQLASEADLSYFLMWGDKLTLFSGIWLDPSEADGPNNGHIATINIGQEAHPLQILDETHLSGNLPALAADGQTVAFDVYAAGQGETATGRIYNPDSGLTVFDPEGFSADDELIKASPFNPTWSPDGRKMTWFASTGERVGLQVYDLDANTVKQIFDWDPARFGGGIPAPVWSPDGQWLALEVLANGPQGSGIWLIGADGSSQTSIDSLGHAPYWVNDTQLLFSTAYGSRLFDVNLDAMYHVDLSPGSWVLGVTSPSDLLDGQDDIPIEETTFTFVLTMQDVPMYDGPSDSYNPIGEIFEGQLAKIKGRSPETGWWQVICADVPAGSCWVSDDSAYTLATESETPAAETPNPAELPATESQSSSSDGRWQATVTQTDPVIIFDFERFYTSLSVTDGTTTWTPIDEWRNYGLGYIWPAIYRWSGDSRYLYYTNVAQPDGCVAFMNGTDLYRLDTVNGMVETIIPSGATASLAMAEDESAVAYTHWDGEKSQLVVRGLITGEEMSAAITEAGRTAQAGNILWSPDMSQIFLVVVYDACLPEQSTSILRVDLDSMTPTILVDQSDESLSIVDWPNADEAFVRLAGDGGVTWLMDVRSGALTAE